ncbi:MAG: sensor domain-containing diguanylate cyclase [Planctomycetes bacterium]|nr:sensor domain-containing diguanylate cyclase [Planctomycetota bacterium]MCK5172195.1 sensor domain-containing diguanylate cyclase [Planctomycetota bacterium]
MEAQNASDNTPPASQKDQLTSASSLGSLEVITPLAKHLNCLDIKKIADVCVNDLPKLLGARLASLYILDESSDILHLQKNSHPFLINNIVSLNQNPPSPMVSAIRSKELMVVGDFSSDKNPGMGKTKRAFTQNYLTDSCIIAPLICLERVVGVLNLTDKIDAPEFTTEDVSVIDLFRQLIGASIGNINLFEKTQRQAETDGLTGMLNHRTFYETLEAELRRSQRYGGQISIIMADVDNLKPINDTHGHRAGDLAIKQISRRISACIRQIDAAARYGGDEFAVILPNTSLSDAVVVAERMVKMVSSSPMIWEQNQMNLSISVGVGQYGSDACAGDVTKATDQAMYAAKQAGKNNVQIFQQQHL